MFSPISDASFRTIYCKAWEVRSIVKGLRAEGFDVVSREFVTRGKVVLIVKDRFNHDRSAAKTESRY